ncbi:FGGY-family carbohydrate kinase [Thorsellia kenyensis]|uniref:FGGY-family carbohydrate kinase n=1 Tax=Thorsellia kenyensis TaxID=1549888 RepID=A0ABV6C8B3_9GAMM
MNKLFLGIDSGSQSTKVGIFDAQGNELCYGTALLKPTETPRTGIVYHPDEDLWDTLLLALENCLTQFTGDKSLIMGIGLCTIRCCRVLLDGNGNLVEPVISWMDARLSRPYVHENDEVKYVTTTSGYLCLRMTGNHKDSCSNQEVNWPIDKTTLKWGTDAQITDLGLNREQLFELVLPGESLGKLKPELVSRFGLKDGIEVFATGNDKAVEVLGSGLNSENEIMISLGTFISAMMARQNDFPTAQNFFPTLACEPFKYVYECTGIRRGMWTVSWFKNLAGEELKELAKHENTSEEEILNRIAEHIPVGSEGLLTLLDWLNPADKPFRKGIMIGFDERHTKYHIYRSILEAIAYTIQNNINLMLEETQASVNCIKIIGGGSHSKVLVQIICDLFGVKVETLKAKSSACLGAAICVSVGIGIYKDFLEAKKAMVKVDTCFEPNLDNHKYYDSVNKHVYSTLREYTDPLLKNAYNYL